MSILYLLKSIDSGEPMEILAFDNNVSKDEIQVAVNKMTDEFIKEQGDDGCVDGLELGEYIVYNLKKEFHCDVLNWDNTDNLYY